MIRSESRTRAALLCCLILCIFGISAVRAQGSDGAFSYQGRILAAGKPYNGPASLYLALLLKPSSGEEVLWTNDEDVSLGTTTPGYPFDTAHPVSVTVENGLFAVMVGDSTVTNMAPISPVVWNTDEQLYLRVWVQLPEGGIELLEPDAALSAGAALGNATRRTLDIFVDPVNGNDRWPGHKPHRPKKSIGAAIKALPPLIRHPVTINLADGTYYEEVTLHNLETTGPNGSILLEGNRANPAAVVITGLDPNGPSNDNLRWYGIDILNQDRLTIAGLRVERSMWCGINIMGNSAVLLEDLDISDNQLDGLNLHHSLSKVRRSTFSSNGGGGTKVNANSNITFEDCHFHHNPNWAVIVQYGSSAKLADCTIENCPRYGIYLRNGASCLLQQSRVVDCGSTTYGLFGVVADLSSSMVIVGSMVNACRVGGVHALRNSSVVFEGLQSTIGSNLVGVKASENGTINNHGGNFINFSINGMDSAVSSGGQYTTGSD